MASGGKTLRARSPGRWARPWARRYAVDLMAQEGVWRGDGPHRGCDPGDRARPRSRGREGGSGGRGVVGAQVRAAAQGPVANGPGMMPGAVSSITRATAAQGN